MERIFLLPDWQGSVYQKFAFNYCQRNLWRVTKVLGSFEDAMQECALCYLECADRYASKVQNDAHFMALYRSYITCWFATLSVLDSRYRKTEEQLILFSEPETQQEGELAVAFTELSSELQDVLRIFLTAPDEIIKTLRNQTTTHSMKQFWRTVLAHCGVSKSKADALEKELEEKFA